MLIEHLVADQPGDVAAAALEKQAATAALVLRRTPETVKGWISQAREKMQERAVRYVEIHSEAAEGALAAREFDVAAKAAQWAIERVSDKTDSQRIVEAAPRADAPAAAGQVQVLIGVALGGMSKDSAA